eukprot:Skav203378  [mRNA]  locus=scaffold3573:23749:24308:- [translate_table: standard]
MQTSAVLGVPGPRPTHEGQRAVSRATQAPGSAPRWRSPTRSSTWSPVRTNIPRFLSSTIRIIDRLGTSWNEMQNNAKRPRDGAGLGHGSGQFGAVHGLELDSGPGKPQVEWRPFHFGPAPTIQFQQIDRAAAIPVGPVAEQAAFTYRSSASAVHLQEIFT